MHAVIEGPGKGFVLQRRCQALLGQQALRTLDRGVERGAVRGIVRGLAQGAQAYRKRDRKQGNRGQHLDEGEAAAHGDAPSCAIVTAPVSQSTSTRALRRLSLSTMLPPLELPSGK